VGDGLTGVTLPRDVGEAEVLVDGRRWHYYVTGRAEAPVIVFVHGFRGSARFLAPAMSALSDRWRIIAPDLPGHGRSEPWDPEEDAVEQWMLLEGFLNELEVDRMALVGNSRGGAVSIQLAAYRSDRVWALVLAGSSGVPFKVGTLNVREMVTDPSLLSPELLDALRESAIASRGYEEARRRAMEEGGLERNLTPILGRIKAPTLLIWGSEDRTVPVEVSGPILEGIEGSVLRTIEGAAHILLLDRPDETFAILREFFGAHGPGP
jgi:pimeloyl-ACP methyl ester carboxylesterase